MELHRLRASQVSAAQPLNIIYHRRQKLSNGFLVVLIVYAFLFVVILFILKYLSLYSIDFFGVNDILSNTIVLKMIPEKPELQEIRTIKIQSEIDESVHEYTHHAIEVFKEYGRYKVLDILHTNRVMWLEDYLDNICKVNHCSRDQLRYFWVL